MLYLIINHTNIGNDDGDAIVMGLVRNDDIPEEEFERKIKEYITGKIGPRPINTFNKNIKDYQFELYTWTRKAQQLNFQDMLDTMGLHEIHYSTINVEGLGG